MVDDPVRSVCHRCGAWKELPLSRCGGCGAVPSAAEAPLALLASTRMTPEADLVEVQRRLLQGTPLAPSPARLEAARALLRGETVAAHDRRLSGREWALLGAATAVLTPLLPLAVAFTFRDAPAGKQALWCFAGGVLLDGALFLGSLGALD